MRSVDSRQPEKAAVAMGVMGAHDAISLLHGAIVICAILLCTVQVGLAGVFPFSMEHYELGQLPEGTETSHRLEMKNVSGHTVNILSIESDCAYLSVENTARSLAPGESFTVTVEMDTELLSGWVVKEFEVYTDLSPEPYVIYVRSEVIHTTIAGLAPESVFGLPCVRCHLSSGTPSLSGEALYDSSCRSCHGDKGGLVYLTRERLMDAISNGVAGKMMPGFLVRNGGPLRPAQVDSLVRYIKN